MQGIPNKPLISPREAVRLYRYVTWNAVKAGQSVAIEYQLRKGFDPDNYDDTLGCLACVWNAGRIQGIREERLRNKLRSAKQKLPGCKPTGAIRTSNGRTIPLFEMGGFINSQEGWNLYVKCSNASTEAMKPYYEAKAAWEAEQQKRR